jgi:tetratricopeptide (TPR) repeat protein
MEETLFEPTSRRQPDSPQFEESTLRDEVGSASDDAQDILSIAEDCFQQGNLHRAEQILQQLLLQDTKSPQVYYLLGAIYYDQGKHHRAEIAFKRCMDMNPEHRDSAIALTILYNDLGEYEKAEEVYRAARLGVEQRELGKDSHLAEIFARKHDELGDLYVQHELYQEAFHEYDKASKHAPQTLELAVKAAKALEKAGARQAAIEKLKELKLAYPEFLPSRLALGMCYFNAHRIPEAVAEWEAILKRDPSHNEAKIYLKVASQSQMTCV